MRTALCASLAVTLALAACQKSDPPAKFAPPYKKHPMYAIIETPAESPYEQTLDSALATSMVPDAMQQICSQWYPEFGRDVADAYVEWRERNKKILDELQKRSTDVWTRRAGPDVAYVKMVYPHLRKDLIKSLMHETDAMTVDEFKANCANYIRDVRSERWNLEKRLSDELREIRRTTRAAATPS